MASIENLIYKKLTLNVFLLVGFFVISLPVLFSFDYLLFGEKVNGVAKDLHIIKGKKSSFTVSQIEYMVGDKSLNFFGPKNVLFDKGEIVEIYYLKNHPNKATLASPQYFYMNYSLVNIICTIFMIFWIALFLTYGIRFR